MSNAASEDNKKWQVEIDRAINSLSEEGRVDWWRVVKFLYRNDIRNSQKQFPLQFDLNVSKGELHKHDDVILREISRQAEAVFIIGGGQMFNPRFGPDIIENIKIIHEPNTYAFVTGRMAYLHKNLGNKIKAMRAPEQHVKLQPLSRSNILLDLDKGTLAYKNNRPERISPSNHEIKMLELLIKSKGIVQFTELGKVLNLNAYNDSRTNDSESLREAAHAVKSKLITLLQETGIPKKTARAMIKNLPKIGYIFVDLPT